jgi:hypothetical protein
MARPDYSILVPEETWSRLEQYLHALQDDEARPGRRLQRQLRNLNLASLTERDLLGNLLETKSPQIFAESAVAGDGSDWTSIELCILGDISVAVPVTIFDDGNHRAPRPHPSPFQGELLFTPGALLNNGRGQSPADWAEATGPDQRLCPEGYYNLYRRRLRPVFEYIDGRAGRPRSALLTIPGLGCGQFAGPFRGRLGERLRTVLERFLMEYGESFPNVTAVYYDPYSECENTRREIHGISLLVRPLLAPGNARKSQLCPPETYEDKGDDFSRCTLFSLVAWDHVSWPA